MSIDEYIDVLEQEIKDEKQRQIDLLLSIEDAAHQLRLAMEQGYMKPGYCIDGLNPKEFIISNERLSLLMAHLRRVKGLSHV